jgi:acyl-coenzyme A thioesterase PaaI-like protein
MQAHVAVDAVQDVPFVRHSGIEVVTTGHGWAISGVDQRPEFTSHAGTFQGSVLYAVAEVAVSAVLVGLAERDLPGTLLVVAGSSIVFERPARDRVTAHATLSELPERIEMRYARDGATALAVIVRIYDGAGEAVGRAEFSCRMTRRLGGEAAA